MKHTPEVQQLLDQMKNEIAVELGITELNGNSTSRDCGRVGGQMTQKLIQLGQIKLLEMHHEAAQNTVDLKQPFYHEKDSQKSLYLQ